MAFCFRQLDSYDSVSRNLFCGWRLRAENTITLIRDVFYKREAWCNKKKEPLLEIHLKKN